MREQYDSVRRAAGLVDSSDRGTIWVKGSDRVSFLHAMISNDVQELETGQGRYGTFLTHTGRILCDFDFYKLETSILLDVEKSLVADLLGGLGQFIIMEDVELEDGSADWCQLSLQGPSSGQVVEDLLKVKAPEKPFGIKAIDAHLFLINRPRLAPQGFQLMVPAQHRQEWIDRVLEDYREAGVVQVGEAAREILRIEGGVPRFGVDMDQSNHPLEAGLEDAISLTKGCFVGQEAVAKAVHIGGVPKKLVKLVLEGSEEPAAGSVLSSQGKPVGRVTSTATSILVDGPIALGYIKRALARPGQQFQVDVASGSTRATIVSSFQEVR